MMIYTSQLVMVLHSIQKSCHHLIYSVTTSKRTCLNLITLVTSSKLSYSNLITLLTSYLISLFPTSAFVGSALGTPHILR